MKTITHTIIWGFALILSPNLWAGDTHDESVTWVRVCVDEAGYLRVDSADDSEGAFLSPLNKGDLVAKVAEEDSGTYEHEREAGRGVYVYNAPQELTHNSLPLSVVMHPQMMLPVMGSGPADEPQTSLKAFRSDMSAAASGSGYAQAYAIRRCTLRE